MNNGYLEDLENDYLKKIVSQQKDLFFQFTLASDLKVSINFLRGLVDDFFEYSLEQINCNPNLIFENRINREDLQKMKRVFFESIDTLKSCEFDYRVSLPKAGDKWYRVVGSCERTIDGIAFYGTNSDVTSLKYQETEYKISEARSQFANLASGIGVWDWNMVTNEVFYSAQSLKILELENSGLDLISNPEKWDELVHPDDLDVYFGNIKEHFDGKIPYYETYHRVLCNGIYKWILDRGKVISRDTDGTPLRIIGTHTDVTSQKIREQKLQETLDLVNNQKSKLLNFAHIVSHNLKNHTGNLSSLLKMHAEDYLTTEETLSSIRIVSDELTTTIENLVELVNIQVSTNIESQNLNVLEYFNKVVLLLSDDIRKGEVKIINRIPDNLKVWFIPAYLDSILLNLTTNAIKYSDPSKGPMIEYYVEEEGGFDVLCVKDNGLGIDLEKYRDSIFGLYKTFHRNENSTGIGLYITKNQVEAMDGKIEVDSVVGEGTVFKVYFKKKS
ncbi:MULTISPECIES: sensor histidine kinase [Flavobacterium]|uniref:histidine kinase n=1 Tax=Flavobacterium hankyongi TaxID=1176532 RepID=A0ABP9A613_9FLAO|nr:PAS domain-containing protein [Flavobacterium sp. N1846]